MLRPVGADAAKIVNPHAMENSNFESSFILSTLGLTRPTGLLDATKYNDGM